MLKYFFCSIILLFQAGMSFSQLRQDTLLVVPGKDGLYFYHIVNQKETLYSLSREFQVDAKQLATFNQLTLKSPLKIYQLLKIPLNEKNLDQSVTASSAPQLKPLYHKVIKGETLYHISQMHDKVSTAAIKKWNHLLENEVKAGQYLIVGWLNATGQNVQATLPQRSNEEIASSGSPARETVEKEQPSSSPEKKSADSTPEQSVSQPVATSAENSSFLDEVIASENRNRQKRTSGYKKNETAANRTTSETQAPGEKITKEIQTDDDAFSVKVKAVPPQQQKPSPKTTVAAIPVPVKKDTVVQADSFAIMLNQVTHSPKTNTPGKERASVSTAPASPHTDNQLSESTVGADSLQAVSTVKSEFEKQYEQQTDNNTRVEVKKGAAGWFHSNVKPGSGRYYALCNDLPRGAIVEVVNPINQKSVLVKVLDIIPKQKENYNLIIKLSDAAMGDLDVHQSRFWCEIRYGKVK
jgi:LysM repeat protein